MVTTLKVVMTMVTIMSRMVEIIQVAWWLWCLRLSVSNPPTRHTQPTRPYTTCRHPIWLLRWSNAGLEFKNPMPMGGCAYHTPKSMKPELTEKHQVWWLFQLDPMIFPTRFGKFPIRFGKNLSGLDEISTRSHRILDGSSDNSPNLKRFCQFFTIFSFTQNQPPPDIHPNRLTW